MFLYDRDPDSNGIFDEGNAVTLRLSKSAAGVQGNGDSEDPVFSTDGRYVMFTSYANNLVSGDGNGYSDVFVARSRSRRQWHLRRGQRQIVASTWPTPARAGIARAPAGACRSMAAGWRSRATRSTSSRTTPISQMTFFVHDRDPDGNGIFDEGAGTNVRVGASLPPGRRPMETARPVGSRAVVATCASSATRPTSRPGAVPGQLYVHDRDPDGNGISTRAMARRCR